MTAPTPTELTYPDIEAAATRIALLSPAPGLSFAFSTMVSTSSASMMGSTM